MRSQLLKKNFYYITNDNVKHSIIATSDEDAIQSVKHLIDKIKIIYYQIGGESAGVTTIYHDGQFYKI